MLRFGFGMCALLLAIPVQAAGWGSLEGQIVLDGPVPEVKPLVQKGDSTKKDAEICAAQSVPDDAQAFDSETGGIGNVFVYMLRAPAEIHPDLKASKEPKVTFDQKGCRFVPHGMVVRTDQVVVCVSSDPVAHNVHTSPFANTPSNFIVQPNDKDGMEVKLPIRESLPVKVTCDIHPWMTAWWVVVDHPYAAVTDSQGKFKIENLPEGEHVFRVWHEKAGYIDRAYKVTVKGGEVTTLEPVKVPLASFKE